MRLTMLFSLLALLALPGLGWAESETYLCRTQLSQKMQGGARDYINLNIRDFSLDKSSNHGMAYRNPYFFVEGKQSTISVNVALSHSEKGWFFSWQVYRLTGPLDYKYFSNPWREGNQTLTERHQMHGEGTDFVTFEDYRLRVRCKVTRADSRS